MACDSRGVPSSRHIFGAWLQRYARSTFTDLVDSIELDVGDLERRMMDLQTKGMEALAENSPSDALPVIQSERHSRALGRVNEHSLLCSRDMARMRPRQSCRRS